MRDILQFLRISSLVIFCLASFQANAKSYKHPGFGNFLEAGAMRLNSFYGDSRINPYIIPRLSNGELTLEAFRLNWDILELGIIQFGPMINYNVSPFFGSDAKIIQGMERDGFVEYGGLATLDLFVGKLFVHYADSSENGNNLKTSFLSALPIFPLNGTHVWLNILLEYNLYSSTRSNYFFGVSESEAQSGRPAYVLVSPF